MLYLDFVRHLCSSLSLKPILSPFSKAEKGVCARSRSNETFVIIETHSFSFLSYPMRILAQIAAFVRILDKACVAKLLAQIVLFDNSELFKAETKPSR